MTQKQRNKGVAIAVIGIMLTAMLWSFSCTAQVGIATTDPTAALDVNGDLRVRDLPLSSGHILTTDVNGNIGKRLAERELYKASASAPVNVTLPRGQINRNSIALGLVVDVVLPPNSRNVIQLDYLVPVGNTKFVNDLEAYVGANLVKDGNLLSEGTSKHALTLREATASGVRGIYRITHIAGAYVEQLINATNNPVTVRYEVRGYVEQASSGDNSNPYRFNMWSASGNNFNWGRAFVAVVVESR